ncbi:mammaglobin-A [Callospermophilus lateralis]|uniref:mammaglobin-A n=1 Tax=Callospermophilus lateralis TaxID=76772 RepID=UPI004054937E
MKLLAVLLLAALPLYCSAGAGCQLLKDVIAKAINSQVSLEEYKADLQEFLHSEADRKAVGQFKQCFLNQSSETLGNVQLMMPPEVEFRSLILVKAQGK